MAYAVHTRSCTYLLDDDGICRWTLAPTGVPVPGADHYAAPPYAPPPPIAPADQALEYVAPAYVEPTVDREEEPLDVDLVEELVTFSEVTLTIPLYGPEAQGTATPPRRGVIGPGRRLR